jgi:predicted RNA-binding protein Jag
MQNANSRDDAERRKEIIIIIKKKKTQTKKSHDDCKTSEATSLDRTIVHTTHTTITPPSLKTHTGSCAGK